MQLLFEKLQALYQEILSKEKTALHLKNLDRLVLQKEEKLKHTQLRMEQEQRDVEQLEKKSLYAIFQFVLGNKEEQLEQERQEYLQAFLQHQSIQNCLQELQKEKNTLLKSYSGKYRAEDDFDALLKKEEDKIKEQHPKIAKHIFYFEKKIANHQAKIDEIEQAIRQGKKTIRVLRTVLEQLDKVIHWGGKKGSKGHRQTKDRLQVTVHKSENYLLNFEKELYDISDHYELDYSHQIDEIQDFISRFYDTLITDWIIKKRIENSRNYVLSSIDKITLILAMLDKNKKEARQYIEQEKSDKRTVVMQLLSETKI